MTLASWLRRWQRRRRPALSLVPRFRRWHTIPVNHTVLVVVRTETALSPLLDIISLLTRDWRIHTYVTIDKETSAIFGSGLDKLLSRFDVEPISWGQARRTRFTLAISASENDSLAKLKARTMLFSHGFGHQKRYPDSDVVAGMNPRRLIRRGLIGRGTVIPEVICVCHENDRAYLAEVCPPADQHAVVIGDPTLDRLLGERFRAESYRAALGATGKTVIVLSSTWGDTSLLHNWPELPNQLAATLPLDRFRIVLLTHPGIASMHQARTINAWLSRARDSGVYQLESAENWHAVLNAAHCLIADEGSLALYGAALDLPILLIDGTGAKTVPRSPLAQLARLVPRLEPGRELPAQIEAVISGYRPGSWADVIAQAVQLPGGCAPVLRRVLYDMLDLPEPDEPAVMPPVKVPTAKPDPVATMYVGACEDKNILSLQRFSGRPKLALVHQHTVADFARSTRLAMQDASIVLLRGTRAEFAPGASKVFTAWAFVQLVAMCVDEDTVWVATKQGRQLSVRATQPPPGFDPTILASLVFVREDQQRSLAGSDKLRVGEHVIEVVLAAAN